MLTNAMNVAARRLLLRNLCKVKKIPQFTNHVRCTSVVFIASNRFDTDFHCVTRHFADDCKAKCAAAQKEKKPTLFQKFKQMYKDYWYVLVPVHVVTSAAWFGAFYYMAKSGVDIVGILESWNVSSKIVNPLKDSSMGYIAVAYACYKIATPARYTVTLGGTTISINYLQKWGYIKPVPSKERLKEIYQEQKDNLIETMKETKEEIKIKSEQLKDKKDDIIEDIKGLGRPSQVPEVKKKKKSS